MLGCIIKIKTRQVILNYNYHSDIVSALKMDSLE